MESEALMNLVWKTRVVMFFYIKIVNPIIVIFSLPCQENKRNNLKDFLNVAGPMGVTHFVILSKTESGPNLRVARTPQGPTLTFKIHEYSLAVDVAHSQARPRCPPELFKTSPLVCFYCNHKYIVAYLACMRQWVHLLNQPSYLSFAVNYILVYIFVFPILCGCLLKLILETFPTDCSFWVWYWRSTSEAHNYYVSEYISSHWY